jgi:NAD(P)-dependent dehydrogenase (short-subunit alcohol dehydrogenase family)
VACRWLRTPTRSEVGPATGATWHAGDVVGEDATVGSIDGTERADPTAAGGPQRFSGRVAIVTGSTADPSIGRSCALRLAREGASVVINGRDKDRVASTETAFRAEGLDVVGVVGSMDTEPAVTLLTERAMETFGRIDLIVSTVGGAPHPLPFDDISEEQLLETFRLNTWPTLALIRAALARGLGETAGSVVAISSGSPRKTTSAMVSYASAKAALNAMTRTIAADLAGRGVRVNAVSPGLVRTTATRSIWKSDAGAAAGSALPLGRLTEAEDVAAAVCFLLSDDARQITGITLDVDGGNHLSSGWTPIR